MNKFRIMTDETIKTLLYAGIGSRETPDDILELMGKIASKLDALGFMLRSGGAIGADQSFESGANPENCEIFKAHDATTKSIALASNFHPAWDRCDEYAQRLHGRNTMIIAGRDLNAPVNFVICWTKNGKAMGGTGLGIRFAEACGIPVFNLHDINNLHRITVGLKITT